MSWLDAFFFGYSVQVLGVPFPHENVLNFTGAVVGTDDVANGRTTVNVTGGGGGGGITALTGDVTASGSGSVAATVAGLQGNPVSSVPPIAAQLLLENSGATGSAWATVSGDSTLNATGAMVNTAVHGATVPAAGSLTTGNVLQVSGASALTYGAVNLAGGAGYVTGALPAGNIAPGSSDQLLETNHAGATAWFSPGGDLTLASNSFSVVSLAGSSGTTVANSSVTPGTDNTYTAGTAAKRWLSISAVTYNVFAASGDTVAASALTAGALTLGVGGSTAVDTRLHRTAAHVLTLDNNSTGGASLLVGGTAAYVTISQAALTPSTDNAYTIGSSTDRLTSISSIEYDVYHASADANPSCRLGDGFVSFGVGGSTALDTRITRTAAKTLTLDDGAGGTSGVELFVGGTTATQLGITGSGLTFGTGVSAPLITQLAAITDVAAANTTIQSQAPWSVPLSGTFSLTLNSTSVTSSVSGAVSNGQVVVFQGLQTAFTVSAASGFTFTISAAWPTTSNPTATGVQISATGTHQACGNITLDAGTSPAAATSYIQFKWNGFTFGGMGTSTGGYGALYLTNTGTNFTSSGAVLTSNGAITVLYAPTSVLRFYSAGTYIAQWGTGSLTMESCPLIQWAAGSNVGLNQAVGTGVGAGNTFTITSQSQVTPLALTGTYGVTNGSSTVNTTTNQTAVVGPSSPVVFASQPTVVYYVSSTTSSTLVLTTNYTGATETATTAVTTTTAFGPLAGTFNTQNGSATVATTSSQVGILAANYGITFGNQPGVTYIVQSVGAGSVTLTTTFSGTTNTTNTAVYVVNSTSGAPLLLQGGAATLNGTIGNRGPIRLQVGADTTYGTIIEATEIGGTSLTAGSRVVALGQAGGGLSTVQMPIGTGDLVTWLGNANVVPTVAPLNGLTVYSTSSLTTTSLSGTFSTTKGSFSCNSTVSQAAALVVGQPIQFGNQAGVTYYIASIAANGTSITMTSPFTGTTNTTNTATTGGVGFLGLYASGVQFNSGQATPLITQAALVSTSAGSGSAGTSLSLVAQAGQAATGASNNGGAGGNLALLAGAGGTSGSATAGIGGLITKFCGQAWQQITKSASTYSVDTNSTTSDLVIFTDSTSNTVTITLPAPSAGRLIYVKDKTGKAATHNVTISQHSAETIDGASSLTLSKNYDAVLLISDGTNWSIIGEYAGSII